MSNFADIPDSLKEIPQWLLWLKSKEVDPSSNKFKKFPRGLNFQFGMGNFPLVSFDEAYAHLKKYPSKYTGLGFHARDGIVAVDIDNCFDEEGFYNEMAKDIVDTLDTYTERSPSGNGLRLFLKSNNPPNVKTYENSIGLEIFSNSNFFTTVTGNVEHYMEVEERTEALDHIIEKYLKSKKEGQTSGTKLYKVEGKIYEGEGRDNNLTSTVGKFISTGTTDYEDLISMALAHTNNRHIPPLEDKDVERIVNSVLNKHIKNNQMDYALSKNTTELPAQKLFSLDDIGNGERLIHNYGKDIRYLPNLGKWIIWKDQRWEIDDTKYIFELARQTSKRIFMETHNETDVEKIKKISRHASKSCNNSSLKNMIEQASTMVGMPIDQNELDADKFLLNCNNGTINLNTGELMDFNRMDLITKLIPVDYKRKATCELWEGFLNLIFNNNQEVIKFIQRAVGYSLTASIKEQCIFICHGSGSNGKSTFMDTIQELLSDYARTSSIKTFLDKKDDSTSNDLARLAGCRFVSASEAEEGKRLNESFVKSATGGEKIMARFLHKEFFEFMPTFKIWLGTNHKPVIKGTDHGIWRRIMLIPFEIKIPEEKRDKDFPNKLKPELSGILNWAIEGALAWQREGLKPPAIVQAANNDYRAEMDILKTFMNECCEIKKDGLVSSSQLYRVYSKWCDENGEHAFSQMKFSLKMKERGIPNKRNEIGKHWVGIALSEEGRKINYGISSYKTKNEDSFPW